MKISTSAMLAVGLSVVLKLAIAAGAESEPPRYTDILRLPDAVTLATLSNGLTVIVQENRVAPVATVRCFVKMTYAQFTCHRRACPGDPDKRGTLPP